MAWKIDPMHTAVEFSARHLMVSTVRGNLTDVSGELDYDPENPGAARLEVAVGVASVNTREPKRDEHLRSADFFDAENHPTMTYKSREVRVAGTDRLTVLGDLTIRGTTRPVELDVQVNGVTRSPYGMRVAGFEATTSINRKDFGLNWNVALETGGWMVSEEIKITIDAEIAEVDAAAASA